MRMIDKGTVSNEKVYAEPKRPVWSRFKDATVKTVVKYPQTIAYGTTFAASTTATITSAQSKSAAAPGIALLSLLNIVGTVARENDHLSTSIAPTKKDKIVTGAIAAVGFLVGSYLMFKGYYNAIYISGYSMIASLVYTPVKETLLNVKNTTMHKLNFLAAGALTVAGGYITAVGASEGGVMGLINNSTIPLLGHVIMDFAAMGIGITMAIVGIGKLGQLKNKEKKLIGEIYESQ
ncbi:MAG: hypothetical protein V1492_04655 [Candidatus Micrarchaeota archaeon]